MSEEIDMSAIDGQESEKMKVKGMHDIATGQNMINRSIRATRAQRLGQLARVEHEKSRLERELDKWKANKKQSEERLRVVQRRIGLLKQSLHDDPPEKREQGHRQRTWREVRLEY